MVGDTQFFKVFLEDRVQQVSSRSLIFPVEVFKVLALDRVCQRLRLCTLQLVLNNALIILVKGFFALFPVQKKRCELGFALGVGTAPRVEPIHASLNATLARLTSGTDALKYSLAGSSWCRGRVVRRKG